MMILTRTIQTTRKTGRGRRGRRVSLLLLLLLCFDDENVENEIDFDDNEKKGEEEEEEEKALLNARTRTTKISLFSGLRSEFPVSTMGISRECWYARRGAVTSEPRE